MKKRKDNEKILSGGISCELWKRKEICPKNQETYNLDFFSSSQFTVPQQRTGSNYQEKMKKGSNCRGLLLRDSHEAASWVDLIVMDGH